MDLISASTNISTFAMIDLVKMQDKAITCKHSQYKPNLADFTFSITP
jgi:hypothetical protein